MEQQFQHHQILLPTYQIPAHIDETSCLRPVDGVQIVEPAWLGSVEAGKEFPGLLVVVQHGEGVVFAVRDDDNQLAAQLTPLLYHTG